MQSPVVTSNARRGIRSARVGAVRVRRGMPKPQLGGSACCGDRLGRGSAHEHHRISGPLPLWRAHGAVPNRARADGLVGARVPVLLLSQPRGVSTSDPAGSLEFRSADPARVQRYRFGGRTADFLICRECGVYVGVQMETDKGRFGVLNVLSLRPPITDLAAPQPMEYGAESAEGRRLRREARWTPLAAESL